MSRCRTCDAPIIWADLDTEVGGGGVARQRIALDAHEVIGGDFALDNGRAVRAMPSDRNTGFHEHACATVVRRGVPG